MTIQDDVFNAIKGIPDGEVFTAVQIAEQLSLSENQVMSVVSRLRQKGNRIHNRGHRKYTWDRTMAPNLHTKRRSNSKKHKDASPVGHVLEVVAVTKDGTIICAMDDGSAWKAEKL